MRELRAPTGDGEVLAVPDFDEVPRLIEENRRKLDRDDVTIGGLSLRELRALARREVLELAADNEPAAPARDRPKPLLALRAGEHKAPLLLAGHQPELSHPGVWVKNFALNGLARKLGGIPLHLVADTDTLKSTSLRFPVWSDRGPHSVHLQSLAFDATGTEEPYENRGVRDREAFETFPGRAAPLWAKWGYEPLLGTCWATGGREPPGPDQPGGSRPPLAIGERFTAMRREREHAWGCHNLELCVSRLSQTEAFRRFASHVLADLPRFRGVYNAAIRDYRERHDLHSKNHPAPELAEGEAPFWVRTTSGRRERATAASDVSKLRPRALTLTLFARVCLGDFFIHGIGGGKYDEVTDAIIRDYFGIDPPAYQVLSATLHLPLPGFPSTPDDLKRAERIVRDLYWNPQRHLPPGAAPELVERKATLAAAEPPHADHAARKAWFRELQRVNEQLRPFVRKQAPAAEAALEHLRAEVEANAVLKRRDFSWVLYPESVLRNFLTRFLVL